MTASAHLVQSQCKRSSTNTCKINAWKEGMIILNRSDKLLKLAKVEWIIKDCRIVQNGFRIFNPEEFCSWSWKNLGIIFLLIFSFMKFEEWEDVRIMNIGKWSSDFQEWGVWV